MTPAAANPFVPYTCRVCDAQKQETNHWFVLLVLREMKNALAIHEWRLGIAQLEGAAIACGEAHAQILVSRWFESRSFDPGAHARAAAGPDSPQQSFDLGPAEFEPQRTQGTAKEESEK